MSRILVVDPAKVFIQYVDLVVDRFGYETRGVRSAGEALKALAEETFDLVIAQESLPDMSWSDFCRRQETGSCRPDVPVVVLSSDPESFDNQGCEGIIAAGVRTRPIAMGDLISVIQEHLPFRNKRRMIRVPFPVKALIREGGKYVQCRVLNLSEGGVFVMRKDILSLGSKVHLRLGFPDVDSPLEISGSVVYVVEKARGGEPRGMGIQFEDMESGVRERLRKYLNDHISLILGR